MRERNECIAAKCFGYLVLDYEFSDYVSCRILIEDVFQCRIHAATREEAINIFMSGSWKD